MRKIRNQGTGRGVVVKKCKFSLATTALLPEVRNFSFSFTTFTKHKNLPEMSQANLIIHNGTKILLLDFTGARTTAEITQMLEEIKNFVEIQRLLSLVALLDITGTKINRKRIRIIRGMEAHNRPYVRFVAIVGLRFPKSIGFRLTLFLWGIKNHRVFKSRDKALEWLVGK